MNLEILKIASHTENHKVLADCTHKSKLKNPLCGDEMQISLKIVKNEIVDFGYQCKSCIYCQASASVLSRVSVKKSINDVVEIINLVDTFSDKNKLKFPIGWKDLKTLFSKNNLSRKECILLPFKTLSKALKF